MDMVKFGVCWHSYVGATLKQSELVLVWLRVAANSKSNQMTNAYCVYFEAKV